MSRSTVVAVLLFGLFAVTAGPARADKRRDFFESKIRPVLVRHCYECHSLDADEIGGKLRLDDPDLMQTGGESGRLFVAGKPDESLLLDALRHDGLEMPPEEPLPPEVINDFARWIASGAVDPRQPVRGEHQMRSKPDGDSLWSFAPRQLGPLPKADNPDWALDPVDVFIAARWRGAGLRPARDASGQTFLRRLYADLIGLPPTKAQIDDFVRRYGRDAEAAKADAVDALLADNQFGVRWGRHWLDVARYGESNGDDGLGRNATFPHAWRYRDYVIDAFNRDVPYNRFLMEQIAGDLLPAATAGERNRQRTATGFLAIGSKPAVAMNKNFAMDVVDDQINVVCTAVMGLSVACARCHDHKHDPIPTRDYYALAGIFRSTETLYGAAADEKLTAPPTPLYELTRSLSDVAVRPDRTGTPKFPDEYSAAIDSLSPLIHEPLASEPSRLDVRGSLGPFDDRFATVKDLRLSAEFERKAESYSVAFWFRNTIKNDARPITAYLFSRAALDDKGLPGDHLGLGGNHDSSRTGKLFVFNGNARKQSVVGRVTVPPESWNHVVLVRDGANVKVFLNGRLEIDDQLEPTFGDSRAFCFAGRSDDFAPLQGNLGEIAVFERPLDDDEARRLHAESGQPVGIAPPPPPIGFAMGVREAARLSDVKIHINGDGGKLGPLVPRGVLTAYQTAVEEDPFAEGCSIAPDRSGRLELARWLTHPDHPQTARVIVNRVWQHLFGRGLVATCDDFGVYGARPSHPRLLDQLAEDFVRDGWSIKRLIRRLVLSRTYGLDSRCDSQSVQADPGNRLLARMSRRRLDAESLRDSMLVACGELDLAPGRGSAIETIDQLINWPSGNATDLHRECRHRSVYLCYLRHSPPKELAAFDLPDGVSVTGIREQTTRPTQTLFLINSPFVVEQSSMLARRILSDAADQPHDRVGRMFERVLGRGASDHETALSLGLVETTFRELNARSADENARADSEVRAWAALAQALMTTNEFRYRD